jgi:xanthosine phosphorylase
MLQRTGATVVTMSAAPEILLARECGMRVAALAAITNPATGIAGAVPAHSEVLSHAGRMGHKLGQIVRELIKRQELT